jgi:hypothetical protein
VARAWATEKMAEMRGRKAGESAVRGRLAAEASGSVIVVDGESEDEGDTEDD